MYTSWKIEDGYLKYTCGCKFKIIKERENHFPLIEAGNPYKDWNYNCEATKMILADGLTTGVFQLESGLGKKWSKRLKPDNEHHTAALTALIRPSCLMAQNEEGVNVTELYCRFKNSEAVAAPLIPEIGYLLENTYYQMIYQEDAMNIAREIAGFDGAQCNTLIKGIGKKIPEIIAKLEKDFIEGCEKVGKITKEQAHLLFENIRVAQRYSFNASHSYSYAITAHFTAFLKVHFPEYFYAAYLDKAGEKQDTLDERHSLISDAKLFDIKITQPQISHSKNWFYTPKFKSILFGLNSIKHVGNKTVEFLKKTYEENKDSWLKILLKCLYPIDSRAAGNIIKVGVIDNGMSRSRQLHELQTLYSLTNGQIKFAQEHCHKYQSLKELLIAINKPKKEGGALSRSNQKEKVDGLIYSLDNPGYVIEDKPEWISSVEEEILGIGISATLLDSVNTESANTTCKEIIQGKDSKNMILAVELNKIEEKQIKNGKNKGKTFLKIDFSDKTGTITGVCIWPEVYDKYGYMVKEKNTVLLSVYKNNSGNLNISKVFQI